VREVRHRGSFRSHACITRSARERTRRDSCAAAHVEDQPRRGDGHRVEIFFQHAQEGRVLPKRLKSRRQHLGHILVEFIRDAVDVERGHSTLQ
jgi:hypothetical protein